MSAASTPVMRRCGSGGQVQFGPPFVAELRHPRKPVSSDCRMVPDNKQGGPAGACLRSEGLAGGVENVDQHAFADLEPEQVGNRASDRPIRTRLTFA